MSDILFICNETYMVTHAIAEEWMMWMKDIRIPMVMEKTDFVGFRILKLVDIDESEGLTYAVQFDVENKGDFNRYTEIVLPTLNKLAFEKWGNQFMGFRTLMEVL